MLRNHLIAPLSYLNLSFVPDTCQWGQARDLQTLSATLFESHESSWNLSSKKARKTWDVEQPPHWKNNKTILDSLTTNSGPLGPKKSHDIVMQDDDKGEPSSINVDGEHGSHPKNEAHWMYLANWVLRIVVSRIVIQTPLLSFRDMKLLLGWKSDLSLSYGWARWGIISHIPMPPHGIL